MPEKPLISFVTTVFNGEKYIRRCLSSICGQGSFSIEILVLDDGSNDSTRSIIHRFIQHDDRVRLFTQTNQGYVASMNRLIALSAGEYVYAVDADNWLPDGFLARVWPILESKRFDFVQYCIELIGSDLPKTILPDCQLPDKTIVLNSPRDIFREISRTLYPASHGGKFIRTSLGKRFLFHGEPTGSDRRWLGQVLAVAHMGAISPLAGLMCELRQDSISRKVWSSGDHLRYALEMAADFPFYSKIKNEKHVNYFPQLVPCFDHFYCALQNANLHEERETMALFSETGRMLGRNKKLWLGHRVGVKNRIKIFLICKFPSLYIHFMHRRNLAHSSTK